MLIQDDQLFVNHHCEKPHTECPQCNDQALGAHYIGHSRQKVSCKHWFNSSPLPYKVLVQSGIEYKFKSSLKCLFTNFSVCN